MLGLDAKRSNNMRTQNHPLLLVMWKYGLKNEWNQRKWKNQVSTTYFKSLAIKEIDTAVSGRNMGSRENFISERVGFL